MISLVVADDEAAVRESLTVIFDAEDDLSVVGTAADGDEAVTMAQALAPDVVVMDLRMPGADGVVATRRLVGLGLPLSVLALTTFATEETAIDAIRAGAVGFCAKADSPTALIAAVRAAAAGDAVVSPTVLRVLLQHLVVAPVPAVIPAGCSVREIQVLALIAQGAGNPEIAMRLFISDATVRSHIYHLRTKLAVSSRAQLVVKAFEFGVHQPTS